MPGYEAGAEDAGSGELLAEAQALQDAFHDLDAKQRQATGLGELVMFVTAVPYVPQFSRRSPTFSPENARSPLSTESRRAYGITTHTPAETLAGARTALKYEE
jgi:hypothetical protein